MKAKSFSGPTCEFVKTLRNKLNHNKKDYYILQAIYKDQAVAGISLVTHGKSGTYLLGERTGQAVGSLWLQTES